MRKAGIFLIALCSLTITCFGQDDLSTYGERRREFDERNKTLDNWVRGSESQRDGRSGLPRRKKSLTGEEKAKLAPLPGDLVTYSQFLKKGNIIRLLNLSDCNVRVVNVDDLRCLSAPQITGMGSLYSFRAKSYVDTRLIDIRLAADKFSGWNQSAYSLFTELGDVSLETPGLKDRIPLRKMFPATRDISRIVALKKQFDAGIEVGGQLFSSSVPVRPQTTYLFYSGSYDFYRRSFDEIIVAFRVVRKEPDGSVVLLWKKL